MCVGDQSCKAGEGYTELPSQYWKTYWLSLSAQPISKHLRGQSGPCVRRITFLHQAGQSGRFWIKVGQSGPCVRHEKSVSSTGIVIVNITFIQSKLSAGGVKWDVEKQKCTRSNCILARRSSLQILRRQCCLVEDEVANVKKVSDGHCPLDNRYGEVGGSVTWWTWW